MYSVAVSRTFVAQHYLTVPDPGPEGQLHSHTFTAEAQFSGPEVNEYGYLVDIDHLEVAMDETVADFRDETLNDLPEFDGKNPSAEHLARAFATRLLDRIEPPTATQLELTIQEDDVASISYQQSL